jgi:hypothetical protein
VRQGHIDELDARESGAYLLFAARRYAESARVFAELIRQHEHNPHKAMELVGHLAMAYEHAGELDRARRVLLEARRRHPKLFLLNGLHLHLRRLPK